MAMALLSVISNVSGVGSKNIGGRALGIKDTCEDCSE